MFSEFVKILNKEVTLLESILYYSERQYNFLKDYNVNQIQQNSQDLNKKLIELNKLEEDRIDLLEKWFRISRKEALTLKLSTLEKKLQGEPLNVIKKLRANLNELNAKIHFYNRNSTILTNRAKYSLNNILRLLSNSHNTVFNVKV